MMQVNDAITANKEAAWTAEKQRELDSTELDTEANKLFDDQPSAESLSPTADGVKAPDLVDHESQEPKEKQAVDVEENMQEQDEGDGEAESSTCSTECFTTDAAMEGLSRTMERVDLSRLRPKISQEGQLTALSSVMIEPKSAPQSPSGDHTSFVHPEITWEKPIWAQSRSLPCSPVKKTNFVVALPEIKWEKPDWALKGPKLKPTAKGDVLKQGGEIVKPVTHINREKHYDWEKPEWTAKAERKVVDPAEVSSSGNKKIGWQKPDWTMERKLRATEKGELVKTKGDLQSPITHVEKKGMDSINFEANPMVLKSSDKGSAVRLGENLARPITHIEKNPMADVNFEANPAFVLHETDKGKDLKEKGNLAKPITFPRKNSCDANFDANPALLKPTGKMEIIKQGQDITRPITFINGKVEVEADSVEEVAEPSPET